MKTEKALLCLNNIVPSSSNRDNFTLPRVIQMEKSPMSDTEACQVSLIEWICLVLHVIYRSVNQFNYHAASLWTCNVFYYEQH